MDDKQKVEIAIKALQGMTSTNDLNEAVHMRNLLVATRARVADPTEIDIALLALNTLITLLNG